LDTDMLDRQIDAIHKSTRTHFASLCGVHNRLRNANRHYYNWHLNPKADKVHKIAVTVVALIAIAIVYRAVLSYPVADSGRVLGATTVRIDVAQTKSGSSDSDGYSKSILYNN